MKKTIGILAHVDAGKTTFSEQILFHAQALRTRGRVDHQDTFLDIHPLERARGITIFSDQACFDYAGDTWYWIDTPGHVDFSSEMERALSIMDYAVLVISCVEGVQSHTETVWRLLKQYEVPVFLFLNKVDRMGADQEAVIRRIKERLTNNLIDLRGQFDSDGVLGEEAIERVAENDEMLLETLFTSGYDKDQYLKSLKSLVRQRKLFPLLAGSALRDEGVGEFLNMLAMLTETDYHFRVTEPFRACAAKVRFDSQGNRMVFLKVLSGRLAAKDEILTPEGMGKVNELRVYNGAKYKQTSCVEAGDFVAVVGLQEVKPGDMVGQECRRSKFVLTPLMTARVNHPGNVHPTTMLEYLRRIEEEEPMLSVQWSQATRSIEVHVMGTIQLEVIRDIVMSRYGIQIGFGACRISYQETVAAPACGIGHFEPLKHYAEVHLKIEPTARGSGISFESACPLDDLSLNWQRLVETHVFEYTHRGVLIGAPLTDVKIILLAGKADLNHTVGGDFREATYRAIRNALMHAQSILLEPICHFELRAPIDTVGRIMSDLRRMHANAMPPVYQGEEIIVEGEVPFSRFAGYQEELTALTHGLGMCIWNLVNYAPCDNTRQVVASRRYNPQYETPDSIFYIKGTGVTVAWDKVKNFADLRSEANP